MLDTKLRPINTMKSKDKPSEQIRPCEFDKSQFIFEYHFY